MIGTLALAALFRMPASRRGNGHGNVITDELLLLAQAQEHPVPNLQNRKDGPQDGFDIPSYYTTHFAIKAGTG